MADTHPWKLVAPWYRWQRQIDEGVATTPRTTRPSLQKFDRPDFVPGFLKDPQRSLRFKEEVDRVFNVNLVAAPLLTGGIFAGKSTSLYAPYPGPGKPFVPQQASLVPTGIRKIFLETHKRHYLVACELHCDTPGFPNANPDEVCQAGLVVRRRYLSYPPSAQKEALALLRQIVALEAQVAELDETAPAKPRAAQKRHELIQQMVADGTFIPKRAALLQQIADKRQELRLWKDDNGVQAVHEGWVPGPFDKIGDWQLVEETPQTLGESTFPMFRLFPDPNIPNHDVKGRALYFGILPTSSFDTDARGTARFDDRTLYEIRCFVRRHKAGCPRTNAVPDCHGELIWSEPTEAYRLAPPADLVGTSNRPITIQVPDLGELAAQAATLPFGKFSPMKVVQPQSLKPILSGTTLSSGALGGQAICFFAIPLITIIAIFVIQIFLPIIMLLFGLWFLLAFKFCIPPSFQMDAALQANLKIIPPSVNVDAEFDVSLKLPFTAAQLNASLKGDLTASISANEGLDAGKVAGGLNAFANSPLIGLDTGLSAVSRVTDPATVGPDLLANLEFEPRVTAEVRIS